MANRKYDPAKAVQNLIDIQKNCLTDNYMIGLYNGLVVAHSCITRGSGCSFANPLKGPIPKTNKVRYRK